MLIADCFKNVIQLKSLVAKADREAWLRFFLALADLALAFSPAIFSSVASEAGNVIAKAVFASVAILLAGLIGVLTYPLPGPKSVRSAIPRSFSVRCDERKKARAWE